VWQTDAVKPRVPGFLRERAVAAVDAGQSRHEVAAAFGISVRSLDRWRVRHRALQSLADRPRSGRPPLVAPADRPRLLAWVAAHPDATLADIVAWWAAERGVRVSIPSMSRLLIACGLTRKKRP
jgi:transposase